MNMSNYPQSQQRKQICNCTTPKVTTTKTQTLRQTVAVTMTTYVTVQLPAPTTTPTGKRAPTKEEWVQRFQANAKDMGELDSEELLPLLVHLYDKQFQFTSYRILIDIGSNVGRTSDLFVKMFAEAECRLDAKLHPEEIHQACRDNQHEPVLLAFEPIRPNFQRIKERCDRSFWAHTLWAGLNAAVGEVDDQVTFYTTGSAGDEQASQDPTAAFGSSTSVTVPKFALDSFFDRSINESAVGWYGATDVIFPHMIPKLTSFNNPKLDIFLLKIDTEGYDYYVLDGSQKLLAKQRVKFLVFEYNDKWFSQHRTRTLKQTIQTLYEKYSYECYWILQKMLVPISGKYWDDRYEIRTWSNVMCGIEGDTALQWLVDTYFVDFGP